MTDPHTDPARPDAAPAPLDPAAEKAARDMAAKQRFIAFTLFRLSGIALLLFAYLILLGQFSFVQGERAKWMGTIFAAVGLIQTIVVPRVLARAFRTSGR